MESETRLRTLEACGLGLHRRKVVLVEHDFRWGQAFEAVRSEILGVLSNGVVNLEHVGSTSVEGLRAKPILDVMGITQRMNDLDAELPRLEPLGYELKGEFGIPGRRYAVLRGPVDETSYVHLHVYAEGNPEIERHRTFRDRLRGSVALARDYDRLRRALQQRYPEDRAAYLEGKAAFIRSVLGSA